MKRFTVVLCIALMMVSFTYAQEKTQEKMLNNAAADVATDISGTPAPWPDNAAPVYAPELALLHDNGPLVTHPGGGSGGADASAVQTALGLTLYGAGHQVLNDNHVADDFTFSGVNWNVDSLVFYAYQTGSSTTSTITEVRYQIWDGPPDDPSSNVVFGDLTTNRLLQTTWSGIYRVLDTDLTNSQRPLMKNTVSAGFTLSPGDYWVEWYTDGTLTSGPWVPPISILGQTSTGNALQFLGTTLTWQALVDGVNPQGLPFKVYGTAGAGTDPNPPTNFVAYSDYLTPTSMLLTWDDPMTYVNGNPLTDFSIDIYRDGAFVANVGMGVQTYTDMSLTDGQFYNYDIYAKDNLGAISVAASASWYAGGDPVPSAPTGLSITMGTGGDLVANWTNPSANLDGTPMDDFDGINLYEDGTLLSTFTRAPGDTGSADFASFTPTGANLEYWVTAVDNESPPNESVASNTAFPPVSAPYLVDFESATPGTPGILPNLWTNETDDDFDWYVDEGGTVSSATGPEVDHTLGTADGNYMFTESSSPNSPNMVAHLTTPFVDMSTVTAPGLSFWYHMHGATMGELHVDVFSGGVWNLDVMAPIIGQQQLNQTDPWLQALVDLSAYSGSPVQVRFRGITGSSFTSDMAIDDRQQFYQ
jgi:hypothetical protein